MHSRAISAILLRAADLLLAAPGSSLSPVPVSCVLGCGRDEADFILHFIAVAGDMFLR